MILLYILFLRIAHNSFCRFLLSGQRFRLHRGTCHFLLVLRLRIKMRQEIIIRFPFFLMKLSLVICVVLILLMMLFWFGFDLGLLLLNRVNICKMLSIVEWFFLLAILLFIRIMNLFL